MGEVWLCVALTNLAVAASCTQYISEDFDGAAREHEALLHGLFLTGTPKFVSNPSVRPQLLTLDSNTKVVDLNQRSNWSHRILYTFYF